jgi:nucleoside-diphosphate-sugar epimerase
MTRAVIIGGSGHVGTYLAPRLVEAGFEVTNVCRGARAPYQPNAAWAKVKTVIIDRDAAEKAGTFGASIAELKPDIVIDMICFKLESAEHLVAALKGRIRHFLHTGTIWVHGPGVAVPTTEAEPRRPIGEYGIQKAAIEAFLLGEARRDGFPATVLHPGHIVGPGWTPLNPAGNFNNEVFNILARGDELALPNFGMETVHHVHADDVAQMFIKAIERWSASVGEAFHTVSPKALTLKGYAEAMSAWFGHEPRLKFLPFDEWKKGWSEQDATATWEHIYRSPSSSIAKAEELLGYAPRYTSLEGVCEAVAWLIEDGQVEAGPDANG